ncbi:MAG: hypothetical protein QXU75_06705 [Candidatus Methanomethylicaceae archaeon]
MHKIYVAYNDGVFGKKEFGACFAPLYSSFRNRKVVVSEDWVQVEFQVRYQTVEFEINTDSGCFVGFGSALAGSHISPFDKRGTWSRGLVVAGAKFGDIVFCDGVTISVRKVLIPRDVAIVGEIIRRAGVPLWDASVVCEQVEGWVSRLKDYCNKKWSKPDEGVFIFS